MPSGCVFVTGAGGGIGRATIRTLSAAGLTVFAGALNDQEAEILERIGDPCIIPILVDVAKESSIDAAISTIKQRLPPGSGLFGMVNNAGVNYNAPLQYLSVAEIRQMVEVNLLGAILLTRAAIPMLTPDVSRVVFMGSASGLLAPPVVSIYAATKFALEGLSDSLRLELGQSGIHVALIEPGVIRTPMTAAAPRVLEMMLARMTMVDIAKHGKTMRKLASISSAPGTGIPPDRVAEAILHALSASRPRSRYPVGFDAKAISYLRHLPDGVRDLIQRKSLGY